MAATHECEVSATAWPGVQCVRSHSSRSFPRHWHGTFGIGLMDEGGQVSASGRGSVSAYPGQIITSNPGEVHDGRPMAGAPRRWRMLYLEPEAMAALVAPAGEPASAIAPEIVAPVLDDARVRARLHRLFCTLEHARADAAPQRPDAARTLLFDERLVSALGALMVRHSTRPGLASDAALAKAPVFMARDCLADRCALPPSLAELAALVGMSRFQLLRRFASEFGMSPYAWLLLRRADAARRLIGAGQPLADAAAASGFSDQSHMTRTFVKHFGYAPGAWRRAQGRA